jgi:hypothetical protein
MSSEPDHSQPMSKDESVSPEGRETQQHADSASAVHGKTGEGAGSALAQLISQEQSRIFPGGPEEGVADKV